jgi:uncharacterized tellurite resistance protein B-like protein
MTSAALDPMKDRLPLVADLLMDAAHADETLSGEEKVVVKRLLREVLEEPVLPMDLDFHIEEFAPERFDLAKTAAAFASETPAIKRRILELCAAVHAADGEIDFKEDEQLRRVAEALGVPAGSYDDMLVTVIEEIDVSAEDLDRLRYGDAPK